MTGRCNSVVSAYDDYHHKSPVAEKMYGDFFPFLRLRKIDVDCFEACDYFFHRDDFEQTFAVLFKTVLRKGLIENKDCCAYRRGFLAISEEKGGSSEKPEIDYKQLALNLIELIST